MANAPGHVPLNQKEFMKWLATKLVSYHCKLHWDVYKFVLDLEDGTVIEITAEKLEDILDVQILKKGSVRESLTDKRMMQKIHDDCATGEHL